MPRAPTAAHAMLSLSEVPCYESSVMKAWLNCLESERVSAGAAIGSIASIFDVSMVGGGGHRGTRPDRSEPRGEGLLERRGIDRVPERGGLRYNGR